MALRVGFVGLGTMGIGMARNLGKAGFPLALSSRTASKARSLAEELGARAWETPREVAAASDVVVSCLPDAPEVDAQRTRLLKERELAWLTLADILLALGEHDRLLPHLHAKVVADPLCERSWIQLITALHQSGRSGEALAFWSKARGEIARAHRAEPGADMQHLRDLLLAGQPAIVPVPLPSAGLAGNMPASLAMWLS